MGIKHIKQIPQFRPISTTRNPQHPVASGAGEPDAGASARAGGTTREALGHWLQ